MNGEWGRVLRWAFDPAALRARRWSLFIAAVAAYVSLTWLVDGLSNIIGARFGYGILVPVAAIFLAASLGGIRAIVHRLRRQTPSYHLQPPPRRRGLILALSPFNSRRAGIGDPQDLRRRLERGWTADDEAEIGRTNWGPLYVAVRHHAPVLEYCWILCSPASRGQFDVAKTLVEGVAGAAGRRVAVVQKDVEDASNVALAVEAVEGIFREARHRGLDAGEVIADLTGGTAAMSAGMVLATLPEGRLLQYLRQDFGNRDLDLNGPDGRLRTGEDLVDNGVLVALDVGVSSLPEAAKQEVD